MLLRRTDDLTTPTEDHPYLGDMTLEEFLDGLDIAHRLRSPRTRSRSARELLKMGPAAVRLAAYTIEEVICDRSATDDDIELQEDVAADLVRTMGPAAAPVLDDLATHGHANLIVNGWAQELLFEVLGLEGEARRGACHHGMKLIERRGGREVRTCVFCGAEFWEGDRPTEEPAPAASEAEPRGQGSEP